MKINKDKLVYLINKISKEKRIDANPLYSRYFLIVF